MNEIERYASSTGNILILRSGGTRWEVANYSLAGDHVCTETSVSGTTPFTEEEARAEFERWRV